MMDRPIRPAALSRTPSCPFSSPRCDQNRAAVDRLEPRRLWSASLLPRPGYVGGDVGLYKRNHVPWVDFSNVPASENMPFSRFPSDFSNLPTASFVVPNLEHDMHSGTISAADAWLKQNIGDYARWAMHHNS